MTRDWKNFYIDNYIHHITGTVHCWQPILLCPKIIDLFYEEYISLSEFLGITTFGYVIMPEHFHLLITADKGEKVMRFIRGFRRSVSGKTRRIIEWPDGATLEYYRKNAIDCQAFYIKTAGKSEFRFWKEKPRVFAMNFDEDIGQKLNYIHNNPVRRGLVGIAEDWPHSSARAYLYNEPVRIPVRSIHS